TSGGKPADGKKPKVQKVDAWDRPSVNLNKVQALTIAKLVDDYRAGEIGLVIDKIIVNPEGKLVIFLHDTASNFFPKWKAYLSDEGVLGRKFRSRVSTRRVVVREGFKYLYSTNYNVNECAMAARSLFKGTGNGSALGRKLQTCGNLKERKAKRSALYGLASKRYELIKAAGEAYSKKENRDGITWHEVLSHTASQFMQDHKQEKKINVNDLVKTLKARR
ncbi:MAG: hypothetical protein HRU12_17710, partial [Phaeodactylibacter sp.]|nr:hypothetical protein [Phaeodactylibacter sp.]